MMMGKDAQFANGPIRILQIGEGNFLRGFFDWMLQVCRERGLYEGTVAVVQPRPSGRAKIEALKRQYGEYTLVTQGIADGELIRRQDVIRVFGEVFDPYSEWEHFLQIGCLPGLQVVVSNTTEAGLVYRAEAPDHGPIQSFPGKIAMLLWQRFLAWNGAPDKGLIFLPCELLARNGDALREAVLRYAVDWGMPEACKEWIREHNRFLNSLVDRIVPGYPDEEQAERWFAEWGYRDPLLVTAEPYHLWAIEGEPELDHVLPLRKAGLNVHWTSDLAKFQERKVRVLNGAHTWMAMVGLLHGVEEVGQFLNDPDWGPRIRKTVVEEIVPTLPYPEGELAAYVADVFDRFANPFLHHRLSDIAMNSLSKFKARLLPSIVSHMESEGKVPSQLLYGFAALLRYYEVQRQEDGRFVGMSLSGGTYTVRDDPSSLERIAGHWEQAAGPGTLPAAVRDMLADEPLWGTDLTVYSGLVEEVVRWLTVLRGGEGR